MSKPAPLSRLLQTLRNFSGKGGRSRHELSARTQEHTLPPIPPGDHHRKKSSGPG
jgi:hypothetical protein